MKTPGVAVYLDGAGIGTGEFGPPTVYCSPAAALAMPLAAWGALGAIPPRVVVTARARRRPAPARARPKGSKGARWRRRERARAARLARKARRRGERRGALTRRQRAALAKGCLAAPFLSVGEYLARWPDEDPIPDAAARFVVELVTGARACRVCGCTDADCRDCIARSGSPCHWVGADLCSACADGAAGAPGYWMNETSGALAPAVLAYIAGDDLDTAQIATLRAYLRQWILVPGWRGAEVAPLRAAIDGLTTRAAIETWLARAEQAGIDPL